MEKNKKESKTPMKYPAPYSQSWAGMHYPRRSFFADRKNTLSASVARELSAEGRRGAHRREPPQRTFIGQDTTVPHLKYGNIKKLNASRGPSRVLTVKPSVRMSSQETNAPYRPPCIVESSRLKMERPAIAKASTVQKFLKNSQKAEGEFNLGPVFVFRPLEPRSLRALTISPSTHLDIKPTPQRNAIQASRYRRSNIASSNMIHRRNINNSDSNNNMRNSNIANNNNYNNKYRVNTSDSNNNVRTVNSNNMGYRRSNNNNFDYRINSSNSFNVPNRNNNVVDMESFGNKRQNNFNNDFMNFDPNGHKLSNMKYSNNNIVENNSFDPSEMLNIRQISNNNSLEPNNMVYCPP